MNAKLSEASRAQIRAGLIAAFNASRMATSPANPPSAGAETCASIAKVEIDEAMAANVGERP